MFCLSDGPDCGYAAEECRKQLGCDEIGVCSIGCSNPVIACVPGGEEDHGECNCTGTATRSEPYNIPECILVGGYCDADNQCCSGECDAFHACRLVADPPCGNGVCEGGIGEDCNSCPHDCLCPDGFSCNSQGACECVGVALGECGDTVDSCGNTVHFGACPNGATCTNNWCDPLIVCDWYDCNGVCNGPAQLDCAGVCNGGAAYDECGVCGGDGSSCCPRDCMGTCYGTAQYDQCGVCGGNDDCCLWYDCSGVCNGPDASCIPTCADYGLFDDCGPCSDAGLYCECDGGCCYCED
jgi:hypothetical protein